jgi:hypothetical protein
MGHRNSPSRHEPPVLLESTNPNGSRSSADIFGFQIDDEDIGAIGKMDGGDGAGLTSWNHLV